MYAILAVMCGTCEALVRGNMQKTFASTSVTVLQLGKETKVLFGRHFNASVFALTIWFSSSTNCNQRNVLAAAAKKQNVFILNVNAVVLHFLTGICVASVLVSAKKELNSSGFCYLGLHQNGRC